MPLEDRKRLLRSILRDGTRVRYSGHVPGEGTAFHRAAAQQGLERTVAKRRDSRYEPGRRSTSWLKLKLRPAQELVVAGWTPGEANARDLGALVVGVYEQGRLRFAGKVAAASTRGRDGCFASAWTRWRPRQPRSSPTPVHARTCGVPAGPGPSW